MNLRPSGYEPDELPTAPPRDILCLLSFLSTYSILKDKPANVKPTFAGLKKEKDFKVNATLGELHCIYSENA